MDQAVGQLVLFKSPYHPLYITSCLHLYWLMHTYTQFLYTLAMFLNTQAFHSHVLRSLNSNINPLGVLGDDLGDILGEFICNKSKDD